MMKGIEQLVKASLVLGALPDAFTDRFNTTQLLLIWRCWYVSARRDIVMPHQWTDRQLNRALTGIVPTWDDDGKPTYPPLDEAPRIRDAGVF